MIFHCKALKEDADRELGKLRKYYQEDITIEMFAVDELQEVHISDAANTVIIIDEIDYVAFDSGCIIKATQNKVRKNISGVPSGPCILGLTASREEFFNTYEKRKLFNPLNNKGMNFKFIDS